MKCLRKHSSRRKKTSPKQTACQARAKVLARPTFLSIKLPCPHWRVSPTPLPIPMWYLKVISLGKTDYGIYGASISKMRLSVESYYFHSWSFFMLKYFLYSRRCLWLNEMSFLTRLHIELHVYENDGRFQSFYTSCMFLHAILVVGLPRISLIESFSSTSKRLTFKSPTKRLISISFTSKDAVLLLLRTRAF